MRDVQADWFSFLSSLAAGRPHQDPGWSCTKHVLGYDIQLQYKKIRKIESNSSLRGRELFVNKSPGCFSSISKKQEKKVEYVI